MKAVILAGGYGKRLRPLTDNMPKPMIKLYNKPIIEWQIEWLKANNIYNIVIAAGYKSNYIIDYLKDGKEYSVNIEYAIEDKPLDTGGGVKNARNLLNNERSFIVINGDVITNLKINYIINDAYIGTLALVPLYTQFGIVETNDDIITGFIEKPIINDYWINAGIYHLRSDIFDYLPDNGSIERITFPRLANERKLKAVKYKDVYWHSIDSHKDVEEVSKDLELGLINRM